MEVVKWEWVHLKCDAEGKWRESKVVGIVRAVEEGQDMKQSIPI